MAKSKKDEANQSPLIDILELDASGNNPLLDVYTKPEILTGEYADNAIATFSHSTFAIDFLRTIPFCKNYLFSRVLMNPAAAKMLLVSLIEQVEMYEEEHGEISLKGYVNDDDQPKDISPFGGEA